MKPFVQMPFRDLPERPSPPHGWQLAEPRDLVLDSVPFGRHRVHLRVAGGGPPLLLVHGLMTAGYSWRYVIAPLAERYTVYIPDLVGAGRSDKVHRSYAPDAVADWIGELVGTLGIRGCPTVGNSLGGYLCMRLALRDPGALGRLVNLHSPGVPTKRLFLLRAAMGLPGADRVLQRLVARSPERWVHRQVHYFDESRKSLEEAREYAAPLRTTEGVRAFARALRETLDPRAMAGFVQTLRDRREAGLPFPIPLLLVYADTDPVVPPRVGDALADLVVDAPYRVLTRASHFAHVDAPDRFLATMQPFLDGDPC